MRSSFSQLKSWRKIAIPFGKTETFSWPPKKSQTSKNSISSALCPSFGSKLSPRRKRRSTTSLFCTSGTSTTTSWSVTRKTNCSKRSKSASSRRLERTCLYLEYQPLRSSHLLQRKKMWAKAMSSCLTNHSKSRVRTSLRRKRSKQSNKRRKRRRWAQRRSNCSRKKGTQASC